MSEITSNSAASKNKIKIEMTFEEAVEITQETYNNYQADADNNLKNLNIQKFQNIEKEQKETFRKGNFDLYHKFHDKDSNFSGMTFIYDDEKTNTVNVAIACRGSVLPNRLTEEVKKDWFHNNLSILRQTLDTDSDNCAKTYATNILNKIKGDEKYKNKEINIITLGHSKGGREAQKQMLALINQKNDDKVSICCLTFNSAPMSENDSDIEKHQGSCQNLTLTDFLGIFKDILTLSNKKYGTSCPYPNLKSTDNIQLLYMIPSSINITIVLNFLLSNDTSPIINVLIAVLVTIVISFLTIKISRKYAALFFVINYIISLPLIILYIIHIIKNTFNIGIITIGIITIGIIFIYTYHYLKKIINTIVQELHLINSFTEETTYYKQLKNINVIEIIKAKTSQELKELQ